jgi:hypothetical protein
VPTNRNEGEPSSFRSGLGVAQIKRISRRRIQTKSCRPRALRSVVMRSKNTPLSPGFRNENPVSPRPFCDAKISCEYHGRARSRKLGRQRRYLSGPQKYAVDVRRVGEVPSVRMRRLHRFKTFSCLCANNSFTGVRFECSRLRTMLARTRPTTRTNSTSVRNLPVIIAFFCSSLSFSES